MGNAVDWLKEQTVIGDADEWVNEQTVVGDMTTWMDDQGMEWLQYVLPLVASQLIPGVREATWALAAKAGAAGKAGLAKLGFGAPVAEGAVGAGTASPLGAGGMYILIARISVPRKSFKNRPKISAGGVPTLVK